MELLRFLGELWSMELIIQLVVIEDVHFKYRFKTVEFARGYLLLVIGYFKTYHSAFLIPFITTVSDSFRDIYPTQVLPRRILPFDWRYTTSVKCLKIQTLHVGENPIVTFRVMTPHIVVAGYQYCGGINWIHSVVEVDDCTSEDNTTRDVNNFHW